MVGTGVANVINSETNAFIAADGWYCLICLLGGVMTGLVGYWLAVRRHGPVAMAAMLIGALAAGLITLWIGERSGLSTFHHLLATLPSGAHFQAQLALGSRSAIAFWPLAAGLMAGSLELSAALRDRRQEQEQDQAQEQEGASVLPAGRGAPGARARCRGFLAAIPRGERIRNDRSGCGGCLTRCGTMERACGTGGPWTIRGH